MRQNMSISLVLITMLLAASTLTTIVSFNPSPLTSFSSPSESRNGVDWQQVEKQESIRGSEIKVNETFRVSLVTGDVVYVTNTSRGLHVVSVDPADPSKMGQGFQILSLGEHLYVIPSYVNIKKYDLGLFDVGYLVKENYGNLSYYPIIVKTLNKGVSASILSNAEKVGAQGKLVSSSLNLASIKVRNEKASLADLFNQVLESNDVEKVWLDRRVHTNLYVSVPLIGAPDAWNLGYNGSRIKIAILDTGIDPSHKSFYFENGTSKIVAQVDFTDDNDPYDYFGHGTHVASIAAGIGVIVPVIDYTCEYISNEWIEGGAPMGWHEDDRCWEYALPFPFAFYGVNYTEIYISSNGLITFLGPDSSYSNSIDDLAYRLAIAPAWDDWRTDRRPGDDIYIWQPTPDSLIIRWKVIAFYNNSIEANFEAVLYRNGTIKFNYGPSNGFVSATVGISNGGGSIIAEDLNNLNYIDTRIFTPSSSSAFLSGVAPGALLMNVKVLNRYGWGWESWVINGVEWAVLNGADVISMSLGDGYTSGDDPLSQMCDWAVSQGVTVVVAAGNSGPSYWTTTAPGTAFNVITVGASDKNDRIAWFSSRGPTFDLRIKPDIVAPGVGIWAALAKNSLIEYWANQSWIPGMDVDGDGRYDYVQLSGTSMATPHVSGAAAILLQKFPDLNPADAKDILLSTANWLPAYNVYEQGSGRLNVSYAVSPVLYLSPAQINLKTPNASVVNTTITLTSLWNENVTLRFDVVVSSVDNPGLDIPSDAFYIANETIVLPAGGKANVAFVANFTSLPSCDLWGLINTINATGGNILAHGVFSAFNWHRLTVQKIDINGNPAGDNIVIVFYNESRYRPLTGDYMWYGYTDSNGMMSVYLPEGFYNVATSRYEDGKVYAIIRQVQLASDVTIVLDERETNEVRLASGQSLTPTEKMIICSVPIYKVYPGWTYLYMYMLGWLIYYPSSLSDYMLTPYPSILSYRLVPSDKVNPSYPDLLESDILYMPTAFFENVTSPKILSPDYIMSTSIEYRTYATPMVSAETSWTQWMDGQYNGSWYYLYTWSLSYKVNIPKIVKVRMNPFWLGTSLDLAELDVYVRKYRDLPGVITPYWSYYSYAPLKYLYEAGKYESRLYLTAEPEYRVAGSGFELSNGRLTGINFWSGQKGALNWTLTGLSDATYYDVKVFINGTDITDLVSKYWWWGGSYIEARVYGINFSLPAKVEVLHNFTRIHTLSNSISAKHTFIIENWGDGWYYHVPLQFDYERGIEVVGLDANNTLTTIKPAIVKVYAYSYYNLTHAVLKYRLGDTWYNSTLLSGSLTSGYHELTFALDKTINNAFVDFSICLRDIKGNEMEQNITRAIYIRTISAISPLYAFVTGLGGEVWYREFDGEIWGSWKLLGGIALDSPSAAFFDGKLYVAVRGDSNSIWYGYIDVASGTFSGWIPVPGLTSSRPTLVSTSNGVLMLVRGLENDIWAYPLTQPAPSWIRLPGATVDSPAATALGDRVHIVVRGLDNYSLWHGILDVNTWSFSGWTNIAGLTDATLDLCADNAGKVIYLAVKGLNGGIYINIYTESLGWHGWINVAGGFTDKGPAIQASDHLIIMIKDLSQGIWINLKNPDGTWAGWQPIDGLTPHQPELISTAS